MLGTNLNNCFLASVLHKIGSNNRATFLKMMFFKNLGNPWKIPMKKFIFYLKCITGLFVKGNYFRDVFQALCLIFLKLSAIFKGKHSVVTSMKSSSQLPYSGCGARRSPTSFSRVTPTKVGISPRNFLTFNFNLFSLLL